MILSLTMFSPQLLLSNVARDRCVASLKEFPSFIQKGLGPPSKASVLVPLCVVEGEVCLLYTLRSTNLKNHSGQVSFPGGKRDNDETNVETALRETEEEIGISRKDIEVWGEMSEFQGRNKEVVITPVVGVIKDFDMAKLKCSIEEVEEVFTVPMASLCDANNHAYLDWKKFNLPMYMYQRHNIWGITGLITHCFLQCFLSKEVYLDKVDFMRKRYTIDQLTPSKL